MKNLSIKERFLLVAVGVALLIAIAYIAIIMPVNNKIDDRKAELAVKIAKDKEYEEIKKSNSELRENIKKTREDIAKIEKSLLAETDIEAIENYVMSVFEEKGNGYLSSIKSEDLTPEDIFLPSGVVAKEKLLVKRLTIEYATTDGYTIPEYNSTPKWIQPNDMETSTELLAEAIAQMGNYEIMGYTEFITGCETISKALPSCMKVHKVSIEDSQVGYMYLRAEVDLYSTSLCNSRVSPANEADQVAIVWSGRAKAQIDCSGGLIGMPIICWDENSEWYMIQISYGYLKDFKNRPAASWFSNAMLVNVATAGAPLYDDYENRVSTASVWYEIKDNTLDDIPTPPADEQ